MGARFETYEKCDEGRSGDEKCLSDLITLRRQKEWGKDGCLKSGQECGKNTTAKFERRGECYPEVGGDKHGCLSISLISLIKSSWGSFSGFDLFVPRWKTTCLFQKFRVK